MTPCEYSVIVLKGKEFQEKHHVGSFAEFAHRKLKTMKFKAYFRTLEDKLFKAGYSD